MKKLMIMLGAVAAAIGVQAASIDWSVANNGWVLDSGSKAASGFAVYLIDGSTSLETIAAAIDSKTGAFAGTQSWVFDSAATDNGKGRVTELTTTTDKLARGTSYDFSVLMIDAGAEGGPKYMVSGQFTEVAYNSASPYNDEPTSLTFTSDYFGENALTYNATSAANGWAAVPEPTSGLLMLLGMAGLALRRRRA